MILSFRESGNKKLRKKNQTHIMLFFCLYHLSIYLGSHTLPPSLSLSVCVHVVFLHRRLIQLLMLISLFVLLPLILFSFPSSQHIHFRTCVASSAYLLIFPSPNWWCIIWNGNFLPSFYAVASSFCSTVCRNLRTKWKIDKTFECLLLLLLLQLLSLPCSLSL